MEPWIPVLWWGFYLALHKNVAEEWFCKLLHFRLDILPQFRIIVACTS